MTGCIFCDIVDKKAPSKKVYEDSDTVAFLDINPASLGHTLVVTKKHYANIYDIDNTDLNRLIGVVKTLSQRMKNRLGAVGVNVLQSNGRHAGQLVDHIHFHVIPRYENDNIMIKFPRAQMSEEQMKEIQSKLQERTNKSSESRWI